MHNRTWRMMGLVLAFCWGGWSGTAQGETLTVAAASNFAAPLQELAAQFEREQGVKVAVILSSTGKLSAQIAHGAPFDLFLAADAEGPAKLHRAKSCGEPFAYATGELVLWLSQDLQPAMDWQGALRTHGSGRIAIANPAIAPYGAAARDALRKAGLWDRVAGRLVYAQNVGQAFQFGYQGSVDLAFVALSAALSDKGREGVYYSVPEATAIVQQGCVVRRSKKKKLAERFRLFLTGEAGRSVLKRHGYTP